MPAFDKHKAKKECLQNLGVANIWALLRKVFRNRAINVEGCLSYWIICFS